MEPLGHVHDELSEYLNGDLTEKRRRAIQLHLADCAACRQDLASLRLTVRALQHLPERRAPRSFALPRRASPRAPWFAWVRLTGGALAATLVVVAAVLLVRPSVTAPTSAPQFASGPAESRARPPLAQKAPADHPSEQRTAVAPSSIGEPLPTSAPSGGAAPAAGRAGQPRTLASGDEPQTLAKREAAPAAANDTASSASNAGEPGAAANSAASPPLMVSSAEAPAYPPPAAGQAMPAAPEASAPNPYPAPQSPLVKVAQAPAPSSAGESTPAPLAHSRQPNGPVWYTPGLGLLALLAVASATVLYALDRRRRG